MFKSKLFNYQSAMNMFINVYHRTSCIITMTQPLNGIQMVTAPSWSLIQYVKSPLLRVVCCIPEKAEKVKRSLSQCPLVVTNIAIANDHVLLIFPINMVIFHRKSVSLREANRAEHHMCETINPIIIVYRYPYFPIRSPWMVIYHQNLSAWDGYINDSIHCIDLYLHQTAYPLVNTYATMARHHFPCENQLSIEYGSKSGTPIYNWMVTT